MCFTFYSLLQFIDWINTETQNYLKPKSYYDFNV